MTNQDGMTIKEITAMLSAGPSPAVPARTKTSTFPTGPLDQSNKKGSVSAKAGAGSTVKGYKDKSEERNVGSSTLLPQTGGGYGFHLNTSAPVTTRASPQQINTLEVLHFDLKQEGVMGST